VAGAVLGRWPSGGAARALPGRRRRGGRRRRAAAPVVLADPRDAWDQTLGFAPGRAGPAAAAAPGLDPGSLQPNKVLDHYFPYVLLAGAALWARWPCARAAPLRDLAPGPLLLSGVALPPGPQRRVPLHPAGRGAAVLLVTVAARERAAGRTATFASACAVVAVMALHFLDEKRIQALSPPPLSTLHVDVADGVKAETSDAAAIAGVVRYVRARVPPGRPVFVANPRYDRVKVGDPLLYVLLNRPNPTRYDVMQPGVVTTAPVQREIARDLDRARPALIVKWLAPWPRRPSPTARASPAACTCWTATSRARMRRSGGSATTRS
jgi:hypothetical protein